MAYAEAGTIEVGGLTLGLESLLLVVYLEFRISYIAFGDACNLDERLPSRTQMLDFVPEPSHDQDWTGWRSSFKHRWSWS